MPVLKYSSQITQPMPGAQGSTRKVEGSGTMVRFGEPVISSSPMPPPWRERGEGARAGGIERRGRDIDVVAARVSADRKAGIVTSLVRAWPWVSDQTRRISFSLFLATSAFSSRAPARLLGGPEAEASR